VAFLPLAFAGCGLAHSRAVLYPNGDGTRRAIRQDRKARAEDPVVESPATGRALDIPLMIGP